MINTTLCYIEHDGKYLLLHRDKKENDLNEGKWIGVGGKFLPGESPDECLVREVKEETGLILTEYIPVGVVKFISDTWEDEDMYLYKGTDFEGTLTPNCPEGTLRWVDKDKVLSMPTWEGDKYFLKPLLEGRTNLNITVSYKGDILASVSDDSTDVKVLQSDILGVKHGFSTRMGGISEGIFASLNLGMNRGDIESRVKENYRRFFKACGIPGMKFVCGKQVHGVYVHEARSTDAAGPYGYEELMEADGYVTAEKNLPLVVFTADCVPVLISDVKAGVVGAIHSGWRSTVSDIEGEAIKKMLLLGASIDNIKVAVGPAICRCCFEVGKEVSDAATALIGSRIEGLYSEKENGKFMLDLRAVIKERLLMLGVLPENIDFVGECTMCHPGTYYSHRYSNGERGSLAAVISL